MRQVLIDNIAPTLDQALFSAAPAVPAERPAGLLNGIAPLSPGAAGTSTAQALVDDIAALATTVAPVAGNSPVVLVCAPAQAVAVQMRVARDAFSVFSSSALPPGRVIAIATLGVATAIGVPVIDASRDSALHMADPASELVDIGGVMAAPIQSMLQVDAARAAAAHARSLGAALADGAGVDGCVMVISDEERAAILTQAREAVEAAEATLARPRPELQQWPPGETRSQHWQREANEEAARAAAERAAQTLTESEARRLAQKLEGRVEQQKQFLFDVLAGVIAEVRREFEHNLSGQGKASYRGPISSTHALPRIKLDLTSDERVVLPGVRARIFHPYSDEPADGITVLSYAYVEAFAEKFRALAERTRPRDLYDVVNLFRNADSRPNAIQFRNVLSQKCDFRGIALPRLDDLAAHRPDLEAGWQHMLAHQLPALLPVNSFWDELPAIFDWLHGGSAEIELPAAPPAIAGGTVVRERIIAGGFGASALSHIEGGPFRRRQQASR